MATSCHSSGRVWAEEHSLGGAQSGRSSVGKRGMGRKSREGRDSWVLTSASPPTAEGDPDPHSLGFTCRGFRGTNIPGLRQGRSNVTGL